MLALPKGWDGEGMIHLAKLVPVPSRSSPAPRTWPRVLLCALCCPGACSAHVPSAPDPLLLAGSGSCSQVGILCEQGRETLTSKILVSPREVRTENAQSCSAGKQGRGKEAHEGVELSVRIHI